MPPSRHRQRPSRDWCTWIARSWGLTQPGMTRACGDSHTSHHGPFGAIAFGIGTRAGLRECAGGPEPFDHKLKCVASVEGPLPLLVWYAKDLILHMTAARVQEGGVGVCL